MAITGMVGGVYVSDNSIPPVPFFDATTTGDAARKRYQVVDPAHRYWPLDAEVTVKVNAVEVTTGFRLERAGGFVEFDDALGAEDVVTVSGTALTLAQAGGFFNWSIDGDGEDADATTFASQGWKESVRTLKGWSGSAEAYWGDSQFYDSLGKAIIVKLFTDAGPSQNCLEGFAIINGDGIETPVDGLVQEAVDFTGTGPLYIRL
ncbi:MAG TPA: hypothetical protein VFC74_01955 [Oscillospiraceae bacterium]|nr:hypothetical protein [Oscillospiraceae bacterium]